MQGTLRKSAEQARDISRHESRETDKVVGDSLGAICKLVLWPENTAPHLAAAIEKFSGEPCSTRTAERYLGGHSDWSSDAQAAIITEVLKRKGMRNVKIVPRR
jgi:hypothetical protein